MALVKQVDRKLIRREWRIISFVFAQLVLIILVVFQLLQIVGLHVNFHVRQILFRPSSDPADFVVLGIAIIALFALYFAVKKRQPALFKAEKAAPGIIKEEARQKLRKIKKEPQAPALLLIEAAFVIVLILAVQAYIDPELELIPWSEVGLGPPLTTAINAVIAVIVFGIFYYLYSLTAWYRKKQVFSPESKQAKKKRYRKK
jgi:hypothetical protein